MYATQVLILIGGLTKALISGQYNYCTITTHCHLAIKGPVIDSIQRHNTPNCRPRGS